MFLPSQPLDGSGPELDQLETWEGKDGTNIAPGFKKPRTSKTQSKPRKQTEQMSSTNTAQKESPTATTQEPQDTSSSTKGVKVTDTPTTFQSDHGYVADSKFQEDVQESKVIYQGAFSTVQVWLNLLSRSVLTTWTSIRLTILLFFIMDIKLPNKCLAFIHKTRSKVLRS